ncbi:hypothetical protein [Aggregatilinea lenta]|uniref:hypothetical protein n=1 Tax=Aggregatilinea lenta TaxID=913108 RepID=UPI000E5C2BE6|nr:hypothetical protein [Aggregatilinea lenta]
MVGAFRALGVLRRVPVLWIGAILALTLASIAWALAAVTVVLFPFGTVGLYVVAYHAVYRLRIAPREVLTLVRAYAWLAVQWTAINAAVLGGLYAGLYGPDADRVSGALQAVLSIVGLIWLGMQFFFWPLAFEQAHKRLLPTLRSAAYLLAATPGFAATILGAAVVVALVINTLFPYGLALVGGVALLGAEAVRDRLMAFGATPQPAHIERHPE